jgi:hypothetical protein
MPLVLKKSGNSFLNELQSVRGQFGLIIERDLHFTSKCLNEVKGIEQHPQPL